MAGREQAHRKSAKIFVRILAGSYRRVGTIREWVVAGITRPRKRSTKLVDVRIRVNSSLQQQSSTTRAAMSYNRGNIGKHLHWHLGTVALYFADGHALIPNLLGCGWTEGDRVETVFKSKFGSNK